MFYKILFNVFAIILKDSFYLTQFDATNMKLLKGFDDIYSISFVDFVD